MALLYDIVLRHRQIPVNKSDTTLNWSFNTPCKSLKGILVLFKEEEKPYCQDKSSFYNPKIKKVLSSLKVSPIIYTAKACDRLSNMMRFVSISPKESRGTTTPVRLKNTCNTMI